MSTYLIDGHNVLGVLGRNGTNFDIEHLIGKIRARFESKGDYIVLIYDNSINRAGYLRNEIPGKFQVHFADPDQDANGDDRMVRWIKENPGYAPTCLCFTNDRELKLRLQSLNVKKANLMSSEDFIDILEGREHEKKSSVSSKKTKGSSKGVISAEESAEKDVAISGIDTDDLNAKLLAAFTKKRAER